MVGEDLIITHSQFKNRKQDKKGASKNSCGIFNLCSDSKKIFSSINSENYTFKSETIFELLLNFYTGCA